MHIKRKFSGVDVIAFDIRRYNWQPKREVLRRYCDILSKRIVEKYEEVERTQKYLMSNQFFMVWNQDGERICYCDGDGFTRKAVVCYHWLEWELYDLPRKKYEKISRANQETPEINFELVIGFSHPGREPKSNDDSDTIIDITARLMRNKR